MPDSTQEKTLDFSGQIDIQQLKLISTSGQIVDLQDYLVEINIYEDIFANFLHGEIMLSDSRNLLSILPIIGEEYLIVKYQTPSMDVTFEKTFRVYAISDRKTVRDNNTQMYTLSFCSHEAIVDILSPLYKPFEGKITDIVSKIFTEFLEVPRSFTLENNKTAKETDSTPLYFINETSNKAKFVSPGWNPSRCINWLASKSIPEEGKACDFLFWETTQAFYFGNIEKLFSDAEKSNKIKGIYFYYPPNVLQPEEVIKKLFIAEDFDVVKTVDNVSNYAKGYLSNRIITLDLLNKDYKVTDYDYVRDFANFKHSAGKEASPLFATNALRNPATHIRFYPINTKLFTGFNNNISENISRIYGNRMSRLSEINNFVINITVPGRSDMEAGSLIRFVYPDVAPKDSATEPSADPLYSGIYLVSAIRHKINLKRHMMIMELVKDSLEKQ